MLPISRRHLFRFAAAVLALVHAGNSSVRAAPGNDSLNDLSVPAQDDGEGGQLEAVPDQGGNLRLAGPLRLTTLDPALARDLGQMVLVRQIYAGLVRFGDDLQPEPALAREWEISDDSLVYTFALDEHARFFSGRQITAQDVVFSFNRAFDADIAGGNIAALAAPTFLADIAGADARLDGTAEDLSGIVALDDRTVQIVLSEPRSTFLMRLASPPASIVDSADMSLGEEWWKSPNASGPFAIDQFSDTRLKLMPNQHYVLGGPLLAGIDMRIGEAAFGALNLYETGEIDTVGVDWQNIERIADPTNPLSAELSMTPLYSVEYIAFKTDFEPFDDPHIRASLSLGFPSDRVSRVSLNGRVGTAGGLIPDGMLGIETWMPPFEANLERARQLITESRYGSAENVPQITIYAASTLRAESFRDAIEQNLGLKIKIVAVDWEGYLTGLQNREYPAYLLYWGADYPDPESILLSLFGTGSPDNYVDYSNPEFDALMAEAAREEDPENRVLLYEEANRRLMDDAVVVPMFYDVAYTLIRPYIRNLVMTPLGFLYFDRVALELE